MHLASTSTSSAVVTLSTELNALSGSTTLTLNRRIGIAAVAVSPSPLPAAAGDLLLPPVGLVHVAVSVLNGAFADQVVTLTVRLSPINVPGPSQVQRMTATIGPLQAFAFVPKLLATVPDEKAILSISISGASAIHTMSLSRSYHVTMSPSGNG